MSEHIEWYNNSAYAAWAQAILTVLTIGVAWYYTYALAKRAETKAAQWSLERLQSMIIDQLFLVDGYFKTSRMIGGDNEYAIESHRLDWELQHRVLIDFNVSTLPPYFYVFLAQLRKDAHHGLRAATLLTNTSRYLECVNEVEEQMNFALRNVREFESEISAVLSER